MEEERGQGTSTKQLSFLTEPMGCSDRALGYLAPFCEKSSHKVVHNVEGTTSETESKHNGAISDHLTHIETIGDQSEGKPGQDGVLDYLSRLATETPDELMLVLQIELPI